MHGLLIQKRLRYLSDESLLELWNETAIIRIFVERRSASRLSFAPLQNKFISANVSVKMELNFSFWESIHVKNDGDEDNHHDTVFLDYTVQDRSVTYHTDAELHKKIVK